MEHPRPWTVLDTEQVQDSSVFRVHSNLVRAPRSGEAHTYWRIEAAEWVNVVPVTDDGYVVMVRQWRHGTREITIEIPGGIVDPGETPAQAAVRETLEEGGYGGGELISIGTLSPNPALVTVACTASGRAASRASRRSRTTARRDRRKTRPARRSRPWREQGRHPARAGDRRASLVPPGTERDVKAVNDRPLSSSPGQLPTPGPLQIRTRRFPPSGSSVETAQWS